MAAPYPQCVLFGDSLFEGCSDVKDGFSFQGALQNYCNRRMDVINRGFSGYNTSQALKVLEKVFPEPAPSGPKLEYLVVLLGANDAAVPMPENSQHVTLERYKKNLKAIITHPNITAHKPKILMVTPPPLDEIHITKLDLAWGWPRSTREAKISASYSEAVRQVAQDVPGTILIDLWKALMDYAISKTPGFDASLGAWLGDPACGQRGYLEHLLPDGLHLSGEAYKVFYDIVVKHVGPDFPNLETTGYIHPEWKTAPWLEEDLN
ncbi:GDSL Lipase/Acylhydrolase family protein [Pleurostoma richardsiae]|uniref:GDSL Lipase/Acylhydrolase family protein n=1 Tax=Pleurostoma richardsiae TaxID=41990 RepID=A0AA38RUK4_9PEZI|nr:GDSL Lipase/Acylhydrolase family protein [Pleurostoma richardsiae]